MKNIPMHAAVHMASAFGYVARAWKLDEKMEKPLQELVAELKPYVQVMADFYEIGEEVAMGDASDPYHAFIAFGEWFGRYIKDNNGFPEEGPAIAVISETIFAAFTGRMTREQDTALRRRLEVEVKEYSDE